MGKGVHPWAEMCTGTKKYGWIFPININPLGMPDFIKQAAMDGVEESTRYPDSRCRRLRRLAAGFYGVQEETLVFGNGAAELIFGIVRAVSPRRAVLTAPSFTEYEAALSSVGAEVLFFPLKEEEDFSLPADRYLDFLKSARPDMIFLCNPANPTGRLTPGRGDLPDPGVLHRSGDPCSGGRVLPGSGGGG